MSYDYSRQYNRFTSADLDVAVVASQRYFRLLRPYLPADKSSPILEIGPGNGLTVKRLADEGYTCVLGLEVDKQLAEGARSNGLNVIHVPAGEIGQYLASRAGHFSLVFGMHVIEHIPKHEQLSFVRSVFGALSKGGLFICETPNALNSTANYFRYNDWTHSILFTPVSLNFIFENSAFEVIYSGNAPQYFVRRGGAVLSILKYLILGALRVLSHTLTRLNYVAEFGFEGASLPVFQTILIVGKKNLEVS